MSTKSLDPVADALIAMGGGYRSGFRAHRVGHQLLGIANCPHCDTANPTLSVVHYSPEKRPRADNKAASIWAVYGCTTCGGLISAKGAPGSPEGNPFVDAVFPAVWEADSALPPSVARFLKQARQTLNSTDASVVMSASAIDAMLKDKALTEGSLHTRIAKAVEVGMITKGMAEWAHRVRLDANGSRHADVDSSEPQVDDAQRAFDYAEALAEIIYVLPSRMPPDIP